MNGKNKSSRSLFYPIITLILFLAAWEIIVWAWSINPIIMPGPAAIFLKTIHKIQFIFFSCVNTFLGAFTGFIIAFIGAVFLATAFHFSNILEKSILPFAVATRAIPTIAIAPIMVLWFGTDILSKTFLSAFAAFFPILINFMKGLNDVDGDVIDLMKTYSATKWQIFIRVRVPYALPDLFVGLKVASSFAVIGAIISEYVGVTKGIGYLIKSSTYYSETDLTFAGIVAASFVGILLYWIIERIEMFVVYWRTNTSLT